MKAGTAIVLASEVLRECHRVRWALCHRRCRTDSVAMVGQNQTGVDIRAEERRGVPLAPPAEGQPGCFRSPSSEADSSLFAPSTAHQLHRR